MSPASTATVLMDGFVFPECPRWHDDHLWVVDMYGYRIVRVSIDGHLEEVAETDDTPGGLGFLPDGTPLAVMRFTRRVVSIPRPFGSGRRDLPVHVDLNRLPSHSCNDMVVDDRGRAYVGFLTVNDRGVSSSDAIYLVHPDGTAQVAAEKVAAPNGMVVAPDRKTLIFATTWQHSLTAMTIAEDGSLKEPRSFADLGDVTPDGICLDAEGAVWTAGLFSGEFLRVGPGGRVLDRVRSVNPWAVACVFGGPDRKTLFMCTADSQLPVTRATSSGSIEVAQLDVPGAGWP